MTILTQYQKVRDQIDTFERLMTKLKYNENVRDQICNLPKKVKKKKINILIAFFIFHKSDVKTFLK